MAAVETTEYPGHDGDIEDGTLCQEFSIFIDDIVALHTDSVAPPSR